MTSERTLTVTFEDDITKAVTFIYQGKTKDAPKKLPILPSSLSTKFGVWTFTGTPYKFDAVVGHEINLGNIIVTERFQIVTLMNEYSGKSFEELRWEDYQVSRCQRPQSKSLFICWGAVKATSKRGYWSQFQSTPPVTSPSPMFIDTTTSTRASPTKITRKFNQVPIIDFVKTTNLNPEDLFMARSKGCKGETTSGHPEEPQGSLTASECRQLMDDVLKTLVKCMQVQNALYRLLLTNIGVHITSIEDRFPEASNHPLASSLSEDGDRIMSDLKQPLEALIRCGNIQRALFQSLFTVCLTVTTKVPDSPDQVSALNSLVCHPLQGERPRTQEMQLDALQTQLESIAFKTKKSATHSCNPFSDLCIAATNQDVIQHDMDSKVPFSAPTRKLPHGYGTLKTMTGEVVYTGNWCEGKRHGAGEALIRSISQKRRTTTDDGFYTGTWKHNMRHGTGKMIFSSGAIYEGQWEYDHINGYGTLTSPDGAIQEGTWKEGLPEGCALFTWPHGVTEYREYHDGQAVLPACTVNEDTAKRSSQMSFLRSQISHVKQRVVELKEDRERIRCQLNKQKDEHSTMVENLTAAMDTMREDFQAQLEKASQKKLEEYDEIIRKLEDSKEESAKTISKLQGDLEESRNARLCQICFEHSRDCIIMPCTHLLYCRNCVSEQKRKGDSRCPTCRGPISGEVLCNIGS